MRLKAVVLWQHCQISGNWICVLSVRFHGFFGLHRVYNSIIRDIWEIAKRALLERQGGGESVTSPILPWRPSQQKSYTIGGIVRPSSVKEHDSILGAPVYNCSDSH
jgi:hypothetical protein